jgi:hypothetical protein
MAKSTPSPPGTPYRDSDTRDHEKMQFTTPQKAGLQATIAFIDHIKKQNYPTERVSHQMVYDFFDISKQQANQILNDEAPRRHHNDPEASETRGRKRKISESQVSQMEDWLEKQSSQTRINVT